MEHKTEQQNNYGWNLTWEATGKFPIIAKRIWKTLSDLLEWLNDPNDTAVPGLIVSVYNDNDNNGVYFIEEKDNKLVPVKTSDNTKIPTKVSELENDVPYVVDNIWSIMPNGVYAVSAEGLPVTLEYADETCIAAALIVNDAPVPLKFMIAKNKAKNDSIDYFSFSQNADATYHEYLIDNVSGDYVTLPELYQTDYKTWTNGAISDFNGKKNTNAIIDSDGSNFNGGNDQDLYETIHAFNSGIDKERYGDNYGYNDWYVPALGQCGLMIFYSEKLIELLTKIGGTGYIRGWSSTEGSGHPYIWGITSWDFTVNESPNITYGDNVYYIRDIKSVTDTINDLESNKADKTEIPTKVSQLENDANYVQDDIISENGVYIYDTDDKLTPVASWNTANNSKAVGVAILGDNCKFVVAKEDIDQKTWGSYDTDIASLTNYASSTEAAKDFDGVTNTRLIIEALGVGNAPAAEACISYSFLNGKTGYLGAAGEWKLARSYKQKLNSALELIGGTMMTPSSYWTSTEHSDIKAWYQLFDGYSNLYSDRKANPKYIRAFLALKTLKERVKELESQMGDINTVLESIING